MYYPSSPSLPSPELPRRKHWVHPALHERCHPVPSSAHLRGVLDYIPGVGVLDGGKQRLGDSGI